MANVSPADRAAHRLLVLPPSGARRAVAKIELLLAEKQATLALMRTGVVVLALPLAVLTVLAVTSAHAYFEYAAVWVVPLLAVCTVLGGFGGFLLVRAARQLHHSEQSIEGLKQQNGPSA